MNLPAPLAPFAQGQQLLLDGALGTELEARGYPCPLPLWSAGALLDCPNLVWEVHRDFVAADADVISTCTFRTTRYVLEKAGIAARAAELTHQAVRLARSATVESDRSVWVAGCVGPVEDCYHPEWAPQEDMLREEHHRHCGLLAEAGVDLLFLETHNSQHEAQIAVDCALTTGLPVWISLVLKSPTEVLNGDDLVTTAKALFDQGAQAVMVNCCPPKMAAAAVSHLHRHLPLQPIGAYPNLLSDPLATDAFADWIAEQVAHGASIIGGCCGTGPQHIVAARAKIDHTNNLT